MKQTGTNQNEQVAEIVPANQTAATSREAAALLLSGHRVCRRATHLSGVWLEPCEITI